VAPEVAAAAEAMGIDLAFLEALPLDLRAEVLGSFQSAAEEAAAAPAVEQPPAAEAPPSGERPGATAATHSAGPRSLAGPSLPPPSA
jgi:Ubiquitin binding region